MTIDPAWRRLATRVVSRRTSLNLTQEDIKAAGGPSTATMRLIEGALQDSYRPAILARLERALGWAPGSVQSIMKGGEPTAVDGETVRQAGLTPDTIVEWGEQTIDEIWAHPNLTDDQKEELTARTRAKVAELLAITERLRRTS